MIRLIALPPDVAGFTAPDDEGCYNIYINKNMSMEMQEKAVAHEIRHVEDGDFQSEDA